MARLVTYALRQGDRALVLAQRLLEVVTHAPEIEEDMALSNLALDLIGQARALYTYAGEVEGPLPDGTVRDEDHYAYWRDQHEFVNPLLVEVPNGDFAQVIGRQFLHDAYALPYWQAMTSSTDATLAAIAGKAVKETAYHLRHSRGWVVRLGDGTEESNRRMQHAIDELWRYTGELFMASPARAEAVSAGLLPDPETIRAEWDETIATVFRAAKLETPEIRVMQKGGREGRHGEEMGHLLAELQFMQRAYPGQTW